MRLILLGVFVALLACNRNSQIDTIITMDRIERDILALSDDSMMGRAPFTQGEEKTLAYIKARMQEIGIEPAFDTSFFQEVPLVEIKSRLDGELDIVSSKSRISLIAGEDFVAWSPLLNKKVELKQSDLIFAGYGINSPEWSWNDFEDINLEGKTIVVLVNDPGFQTEDPSLFNGRAMTYYGRWTYKFAEANRQGAAGCIIVHEDEAAGYPWSVINGRTTRSEFYLNNEALRKQQTKINGWLTKHAAQKLFAFCGLNYEEMKSKASAKGFKPVSMNANYNISIYNSWEMENSFNVGGIIRGAERPDEALVYTAHWDHLGIGEPVDGDSIYNGASDNAAAVAWMLSIAEAFVESNVLPKRSVLFLSPTAEESGMLGSQHYVENPIFSHEKTAACFNSDVILFLGKFKDVTVTGLGHSELDDMLAEEAARQGRYICNDPNPENGMFYRSDQLPFLKAGVPSLFAKGYSHQVDMGKEATLKAVEEYWKNTYHKPSDKYNPSIHNLDGLIDDAKLFFMLGSRLANDSYFPKWKRESEFFVER